MNSEGEHPHKKSKTTDSTSTVETVNEGLNKYLSTMSSTLSNSFKQMSDNVISNLKAVQTMSTMLEKTMIQSYKCKIHIYSNPLTMKLIISTTTFPLNNGKLKIVLLNPKTKEPIENSLNLEKCFSLDNLSQSFKITEKIILKHPQQCNIVATLTIPSPSTKIPLQIQYTTGVYILHQCTYNSLDKPPSKLLFSEEVIVNGLFLRDLMNVKPMEKMNEYYTLTIGSETISIFKIKPNKDNKCLVMIEKMNVNDINEDLLKNELIILDQAFNSLNYLF